MTNLAEIKNLYVEYEVSDIFNRKAKVHAVNNKAFDLGEKYANDAMSGKTYQASCNAEGCKME